MSDSFCIYPFTHLNVKANGHVTVCNRCKPMGRIQEMGQIGDFWRGQKVSELRERLLRGEKPDECNACWSLENSGATSYRQEALSPGSLHQKWYGQIRENHYPVREIELRFGNLCNLKCRMCSPKFSSRWESELANNTELRRWIEEDAENKDIYQLERMVPKEELKSSNEKVLKFLETSGHEVSYVMYSGGEPLLQREHYLSLERLLDHAHGITLEYTTNLNYLNFERYQVLDLWKKFKKIIIKISLDGDPLIYDYVRDGGNLKGVEENINQIKHHLDPHQVALQGTCTTSIYNVMRLPEIMDYFQRIGIYAHTSLVQEPDFLSPQILPRPLKNQLQSKMDRYLENLSAAKIFGDRFVDPEQQRGRIRKWTSNAWRFTNGADAATLKWRRFLDFNSFMDPGNERLLGFYPEWEPHL